ncbi:hypothetical protein GCM10027073_14780 [Streptomyces chlorus]|uniref:Uncharacterized protein n=1 Tax=Streptomyces chlorus TaxID=887452 RepID=A0ABW1DRR9_9ACTN
MTEQAPKPFLYVALRRNGPSSAWRPQLLVTVRRIAAERDGDHRRDMLHPDLTTTTDDG